MVRMSFVSWLPVTAFVVAACGEGARSTQPESVAESVSAAAAAAANTWTTRAPTPLSITEYAVSSAPNAAGEWIAYTFGGGDEDGAARIGNRIYFTGGQSCCDESFRTFNTAFAYETTTNRLLQRANTPLATQSGVSGAIGGKVYVLPGRCSGESVDPGHCDTGKLLRVLWRYDPATNKWTTRKQAPHVHNLGAGAVIGDKSYVVGNSDKEPFLDVYDPATNTWKTRAPIPTPGERLFAAPLQSKLFVISWSSVSGGSPIIKAFLYDPATNKWTSRAAPPGVAGPIVHVEVAGKPALFMPGLQHSYLYTP